MFGLLVIFGQCWGEPWDGTNAGLIQGLPTGFRHVELTGRRFLSVPGPGAAQRHSRAAIHLGNEPQRAGRGQNQTPRMRPKEARPLATRFLAQPRAGLGVPDGHFHCPAGMIFGSDVLGAQGEIGGEKGCDDWGWGSGATPCGGACGLAPYAHDPQEPPRPHRVP